MTFWTLLYRWHDWQHRDEPALNQRLAAFRALQAQTPSVKPITPVRVVTRVIPIHEKRRA